MDRGWQQSMSRKVGQRLAIVLRHMEDRFGSDVDQMLYDTHTHTRVNGELHCVKLARDRLVSPARKTELPLGIFQAQIILIQPTEGSKAVHELPFPNTRKL